MLTFEQIKELIELVSHHGLDRLEVERAGFRLAVEGHRDEAPRAALGAGTPPGVEPSTVPAASSAPAATQAAAAASLSAAKEEKQAPTDLHLLKSPIVGTFYAAPAPDSEPFVRVGDRVRKGQVLCIVEAMKLMNEIESDVDGELVEVMPKNAQPVEYGEPLFAIKVG